MATIHIKYFKEDAPRLEVTDVGSWIDLYVDEDTTVKSGERKYIPLGVAMKLPEGYEAIIAPRSSTFKKWGLLQTNSIGVVDATYCGPQDEWKFPALATRDITIPRGTRICQFRIQEEQPFVYFNEVEELNTKDRGGFGSTGD